jgi:hypothetical protein
MFSMLRNPEPGSSGNKGSGWNAGLLAIAEDALDRVCCRPVIYFLSCAIHGPERFFLIDRPFIQTIFATRGAELQ